MNAQTPEDVRNEQAIRRLYALADGKSKDTPQFVANSRPADTFTTSAQAKNITATTWA